MGNYDSRYWADKGYPEFAKKSAKDEGLTSQETERRVRKAHRVRAGIRLHEARYHRSIGHDLAARRDVGKAANELLKGIFGR